MIRTVLYNPASKTTEFGAAELISKWQENPDSIIWFDLESSDEAEIRTYLQRFNLHPLAIQDASRNRHPPKIERFDDFVFLLLRGLDASTTEIDFGVIQLPVFVGKNFLVTRHNKPSVSSNWLYKQIQADPSMMAEGPDTLAVKLANKLLRRYLEILLAFEPRLDEIEDEMFEKPNDALLSELTGYKSNLRHLARIANYHSVIARELKSNPPEAFSHNLVHEITDLYEQVERTQSLASLYYEVAKDLTDGYIALSSHRLNKVMQILTVITVIFVPMTFLAGVYGMNFEFMPELSYEPAYFIVLGLMIIAAVIQFIFFKRKNWI